MNRANIAQAQEYVPSAPTPTEIVDHMLDVAYPTTLDGDPRCDYIFNASEGGWPVSMRCPNEARITISAEEEPSRSVSLCFLCSTRLNRLEKLLTI